MRRTRSLGGATLDEYALPRDLVDRSMEYAGLEPDALRSGPHPDDGSDCLVLKADIQQYSAFVSRLAVQCRTADDLAILTDQVQLQYDAMGDTHFWLPGVSIR